MLQPELTNSQDPIMPRLQGLDAFAGSLSQKVYQTLRAAILSMAYAPGEILRKPEICEELGVSRSPVSDAVARLAAEGLVDVIPQAGTYVARFSMAEIREGAFLREAIELQAVEMVATMITEDQLVLLRRNLTVQAALLGDGDVAGFYKLDGEMHDMIRGFTGFRKLSLVADTAWAHVDRARQLMLPVLGRIEATLLEHRVILNALEARDPVAARAAMRVHLRKLVTYLEPLERSHPEFFNP
jgi:DNA-binding GntR family transcriptional regulator